MYRYGYMCLCVHMCVRVCMYVWSSSCLDTNQQQQLSSQLLNLSLISEDLSSVNKPQTHTTHTHARTYT